MALWTMASIILLAAIFWLNATIAATPYIIHLSGIKKPSMNKRCLVVSPLLLFITILYFFVKVGSFAGEGLAGAVDTAYGHFIWSGPIGEFVQLQGIVAAIWLAYSVTSYSLIKWISYLLAVALMASSFLNIGHGSDAVWWGKVALLAHLLVAWFWFGSLNSLRKLAVSVPVCKAQKIMKRFGAHMTVAVPVLLIAGVVMYRSAAGQWLPDLPLSSYDTTLLLKLSLVAAILLIAAVHKFKFVPQLTNDSVAKRLKQSLTVEIVLAVAIFIVASALSSAFSPG